MRGAITLPAAGWVSNSDSRTCEVPAEESWHVHAACQAGHVARHNLLTIASSNLQDIMAAMCCRHGCRRPGVSCRICKQCLAGIKVTVAAVPYSATHIMHTFASKVLMVSKPMSRPLPTAM